jgi:hypothetical protein
MDDVRASRRKFFTSVAVGLLFPIALYYGLRHFGVSPVRALLIGCVPPFLEALYRIWKQGRPDAIALFTLSLLIVGGGFSLITGSPQWILAKAGVFTGVIGLWVLLTTPRRPAIFQGIMHMQPNAEGTAKWEHNWATYPQIRHVMRATNAIWGAGLVAEAIVRVVLAYTLPVDDVPAVTLVQFIVVILLIHFGTRRYGRWYMNRAGQRLDHNDVVPMRG